MIIYPQTAWRAAPSALLLARHCPWPAWSAIRRGRGRACSIGSQSSSKLHYFASKLRTGSFGGSRGTEGSPYGPESPAQTAPGRSSASANVLARTLVSSSCCAPSCELTRALQRPRRCVRTFRRVPASFSSTPFARAELRRPSIHSLPANTDQKNMNGWLGTRLLRDAHG